MKHVILNLLLFLVVLIFCGVIIYTSILLSSIEIGLTLLPLVLFLVITFYVNRKRETQHDA
jgi:hypothetical protein